jgi:hypothetical protein
LVIEFSWAWSRRAAGLAASRLRAQRIETRIAASQHEMLRWMLAGWSSTMLVLLGTIFAVLRSR